MLLFNVLLLSHLFTSVFSLNFIFYCLVVGDSHIQFISTLIDALVDRGHTVDLMLARFNSGVKNNGTKKTGRVFSFGFPGSSPWMEVSHLNDPFVVSSFNSGLFLHTTSELCKLGLQSGEPLKFLKEKQYDAAIISEYDLCPYLLMHQAGISTVMSYSSIPMIPAQAHFMGLPSPVSTVPRLLAPYLGDSLNFIPRTYRLAKAIYGQITKSTELFIPTLPKHNFYHDMNLVFELARKVDLLFINSNEILELPRPITHKVVYIGGIGLKPTKPLNDETLSLLSTANDGVVLFSFGTQVPTANIRYDIRKTFFTAFMKFPNITFLWKYDAVGDDEQLIREATNVKVLNWMPQADLLADDRVLAFISHMGLNSFLETSNAGIPVVAIPLFADQEHNARLGERHGLSVTIKKDEITVDRLVKAIRKVLEDPSYRQNAKRISHMLRTRPEPAKQRFTEWVEFAAANKKLHQVFNLPGNDLSTIELYCIDSILLLVAVILLMFSMIYYLLHLIYCKLRQSLSITQKDMKKKKI